MSALLLSMLSCLGLIFINRISTSASFPRKCEKIEIGLCKSLPYNRTQLPNSLEQATQPIIKRSLLDLAHRFNSSICSEDLLFFVCSYYLPICVGTDQPIIKPCRSVCEKVTIDCEIAGSHLLDLPEFECNKLQAYNEGICVTPQAFNHSPAKPTLTTTANTQGFIKKQDFFNANFDFVIKGKILSMKKVAAPNRYRIQFNISRVIIKHGIGILFRGSVVRIWSQYNYTRFTNGTPTYLHPGKRYVFLGHINQPKELTLGWAWAWPRDKHLVDKLKTWKA